MPDIFGYAYCGQPRDDGPGNRGFVTNQRWHIIDDLPFNDWLAFFMELHPHEDVRGMSLARIGYHYARPGAIDDHVEITDEDVRPVALPPDWRPGAGFGMRNAVYYEADATAAPGPHVSIERGSMWAESDLLVWRPRERGETLELPFPIETAGQYRLYLALELCNSAGRISAMLDGQRVRFGEQDGFLDLHVADRRMARQFETDKVKLAQGEHRLKVIFEGAQVSVREPRIGIDYLAVQRQ